MKPQTINAGDFIENGYLQEANRRFFHPLGLTLAISSSSKLNDSIDINIQILDGREDPEGYYYTDLKDANVKKKEFIDKEWELRKEAREKSLGYMIQPIEKTK